MTTEQVHRWWHAMPALPADKTDHAYFALRRIWADHTMAGARGFHRLPCEDHITPRLFQNWMISPDYEWLEKLGRQIGLVLHDVRHVRWAYACEALVPGSRRQYHKREFVIADIMLLFEDASGPGAIAFEVKRPGKPMLEDDRIKLGTYVEIARQCGFARSYGCLIVSSHLADKSVAACGSQWPAISWEQLGQSQCAAASKMSAASSSIDHVDAWLARQYQLCGVTLDSTLTVPPPIADRHGSAEEYHAIEGLALPKAVERFVKGASCAECICQGIVPSPPLPWLAAEPDLAAVRQRKWQTTSDRRVRRWDMGWKLSQERAW